ncbi:VirK/YbjX family protein [Cronobacter universalis]|uniref:VirK/YbjX family protein n=1 Tax=Cronobacter universalis TaxID=535744 RepID=UPI0024AEA86A|nr:VirK/YbjX family protein [Cronobacter universalis]MDI7660444.1 VirK/YbjX family protein [Cronobacter universalis]
MSVITSHAAPSPRSGMDIIKALTTGQLMPGGLWQKKSYRLKFALRSAIYLPATLRFMDALAANPRFEQLLSVQNTLPGKIHRHYLRLGLSAGERAGAIINHYDFIRDKAATRLADALCATSPQPLFTLAAKEKTVVISASSAHKAEREGESTLWLYCDDVLLASLTFSVVRDATGYGIAIGGLQGPRRGVPHEAIRDATKACFGVFPKRLLMEVLWLMIQQHGMTRFEAVSNDGHVFRGLRYRFSKGRHFFASYDEFWESIGGERRGARCFTLPLTAARKPLEEVASKKRSEYRKRYELLDALAEQWRALNAQ